MPYGYPYVGILFLLLLYNAVLYLLWGLVRWKERVDAAALLAISSSVLGVLFIARTLWGLFRGEVPFTIGGVFGVLLWLLGLLVVNTLLGAAAFALARGGASWLERGAPIPEAEEEAPPATWVSEGPPEEGPGPSGEGGSPS